MKELKIQCPICNKKGIISITENIKERSARGLIAIGIKVGSVCQHSFIIYLDNNFAIRDYFIPDVQINIDQNQDQGVSIENIDLNLIKINLPIEMIIYILYAIFRKKKVLIISDQYYLYDRIIYFFRYITENSFIPKISIKDTEKDIEKQFKDYLILKGTKIIKYFYKNRLDLKKLKEEKKIVQKFFDTIDVKSALIILKNEIRKVYEIAKSIAEKIKQSEDKEHLRMKNLLEYIKNKYNFSISANYLDFILEIVKDYFDIEIPPISALSKLDQLNW
ncbi:MAG: hypothetical protein ACP6IY_11350 [Promethearchaeia archaeon]